MSPWPVHGPSSAIAASSATRSWNAASRQRPASASRRARSVSSSQASATSRPPRIAASRSCGRSTPERSRRPGRGRRDLDGLGPAPVGDLLAGAVADADDERALARGRRERAGRPRRAAVHVHDGFEDVERLGGLGLQVGGAQPALAGLVERLRADERRARRGDGGRRGLRAARRRGRRERSRPRRCGRAERREHEHVGGLAGVAADHVAAVGRARAATGTRPGRSGTGARAPGGPASAVCVAGRSRAASACFVDRDRPRARLERDDRVGHAREAADQAVPLTGAQHAGRGALARVEPDVDVVLVIGHRERVVRARILHERDDLVRLHRALERRAARARPCR